MADSIPTLEEFKEYLSYDPETGLFTWIQDPRNGRTKIGDIAGSDNGKGYIIIRFKQKRYRAHRLAWFFEKGYWPTDLIDHKNKKKNDNRFENLRESNNSQNMMNMKKGKLKNASSKYKGVHWNKRNKKWQVFIGIKGKRVHLGYFINEEKAAREYDQSAIKHFGEFAQLNFST